MSDTSTNSATADPVEESQTQANQSESQSSGSGLSSVNETASDHDFQVVTFQVGTEEFAVDIRFVQEINRLMEITKLPGLPPEVVGVVNLRGRIIPILELHHRFNQEMSDQTEDTRIIVVEVGQSVVGFTVDKVREVLTINESIIDTATNATAQDSSFIQGVAKLDERLLILVQLDKLFSTYDLNATTKVAQA